MSRAKQSFDPEKYLVADHGESEDEFDPEKYAAPEKEEEQSFASKLPRNIVAGLAEMGHGILNTPHNIAKLVNPELAKKIPSQENYDYPELLGLPKKSTLADKVIRGIAQYAPAAGLPAAEMGIAGEAAGIGSRMAAQAIPQAAFGATQNENPLHGAAEGAIAGAGGEAVASGLEGAYNALKPSNLLRGNLSKKQLERNLEATKGTDTPLGRVLESPSLNRFYENILPHVIGSGAESTMQKTGNQVTQKATDLLERIRGEHNPGDFGVALQTALKQASKSAREEKNKGFEELNKIADSSGLAIGRENFQKKAHETLIELSQSPELKEEFSPDLYNDLKRYAKNPEGNNLKLTNIFRGKLGDKANELYQAGKMHEFGIVNGLKEALSNDINEGFEASKNPLLKEAYAKNQKDYAEKFAPFEDEDIVKFTRQGGDPDLILSHFLRGGKNDRGHLLSKLTSLEPTKSKTLANLTSYAHLSKAMENGEINPMKFSELYRNLGEKQKDALFPDKDIRNDLERFTELVGHNKESFDLMRNPKTGARNTDLLIKLSQIMGANALAGIHGLGAIAGGAVAGRAATKALTSEKLRTNLIKKMIEDKKSKLPGRKAISGILNMELNDYAGEE